MPRSRNGRPFYNGRAYEDFQGCSYLGTGDIQPPEVVKLDLDHRAVTSDPEIERKRRLRKADILTTALAQGQLRTPGQKARMAKRLDIEVYQIEGWMMRQATRKRVGEKLKTLATYAVAEALPSQAERAKKDSKAFQAVMKLASLEEKTPLVQLNTLNVDRRDLGDNERAVHMYERFHEVRNQRLLERIKSAAEPLDPDPDPVPDPEPEPTEPQP